MTPSAIIAIGLGVALFGYFYNHGVRTSRRISELEEELEAAQAVIDNQKLRCSIAENETHAARYLSKAFERQLAGKQNTCTQLRKELSDGKVEMATWRNKFFRLRDDMMELSKKFMAYKERNENLRNMVTTAVDGLDAALDEAS